MTFCYYFLNESLKCERIYKGLFQQTLLWIYNFLIDKLTDTKYNNSVGVSVSF